MVELLLVGFLVAILWCSVETNTFKNTNKKISNNTIFRISMSFCRVLCHCNQQRENLHLNLTEWVENDASKSNFNVVWLIFDLLISTVDRFIALSRRPLAPIWSKICSFVLKLSCSQVWQRTNEQMNGQTNDQVENIMLPASLDWHWRRHKIYTKLCSARHSRHTRPPPFWSLLKVKRTILRDGRTHGSRTEQQTDAWRRQKQYPLDRYKPGASKTFLLIKTSTSFIVHLWRPRFREHRPRAGRALQQTTKYGPGWFSSAISIPINLKCPVSTYILACSISGHSNQRPASSYAYRPKQWLQPYTI